VIVAASGMLLAAAVTLARQPLPSMIRRSPGLRTPITVPPTLTLALAHVPVAEPFMAQVQPRDPMVVIAPESIDPGMVIRAPVWIDSKMVFTPGGGNWQPEDGGLPAPAPSVPGIAPRAERQFKLIPVPYRSSRPAKEPQYKRVPVPERSLPSAKKPQH
jgi:hypothetical protein